MTEKELKLLKILVKKDKKRNRAESSSSISQLSNEDDHRDLEQKLTNDVRILAKEKLHKIEVEHEKKREMKKLDKKRVKTERGELSDSDEEE